MTFDSSEYSGLLSMDDVKMENDKEEKRKISRKRYDIPKTATCHVCGDLAAEHLHYGGIACYSCRAFFRRTVNSNRPMLDCSGDKNCTINKDTRKRCQWCRFEKCKEIGMKPSWVLSEDDKSKLNAARKLGSPKSEEEVRVKKEVGEEAVGSEEGEAASHKPAFPGNGMPFYPNLPFPPPLFGQNLFGYHNHPNRAWPHPQHAEESRPWYPQYQHPTPSEPRGWLGTPSPDMSASCSASPSSSAPYPNQFRRSADGGFPFKNIQVSLSNPGRGDAVSLTIETRPGVKKETFRCGGLKRPAREDEDEDSDSTNQNQYHHLHQQHQLQQQQSNRLIMDQQQHRPSSLESCQPPPESCQPSAWSQPPDEEYPQQTQQQQPVKRPTSSHQQHSRTIFRHISSERRDSRDESQDTFSTAVSPYPTCSTPNNILANIATEQINGHRASLAKNPLRPQVWKLADAGSPDMFGISFLQETLFLEQLSAIDERVRLQVPMEVEHSRAFLDCALTGKRISQATIMHAYQTCIKRIVRFANSLQDFVELPPDDMHKLLVANTVNIINIRIARWFHPNTSLETQLLLCSTGVDLYKEATIQQDLDDKYEESPVKMDDVFSSPWCCDSSYEDRYVHLLKFLQDLPIDATSLVLLSVLSLFDVTNAGALEKYNAILSHSKKFSLLLHRYLVCKHGLEKANDHLPQFQTAVDHLREMAEILINKRLIC